MADFTDEKNLALTPEAPLTPETKVEPSPEQEQTEPTPEKAKSETHSTLVEAGSKMKELLTLKRRPKPVVIPQVRDDVTVKIEKILEEGVGDAFSRLSPVAQQEFKLKGEATARNIRELLKATHVKVKKIFQLILEWLKLLPGINRFFLEQEAKIKTDRIIALQQKNSKL